MERTRHEGLRPQKRPRVNELQEETEHTGPSSQSTSFDAHGSGDQNNAPGGTQNISEGDGPHFLGSTFRAPVYIVHNSKPSQVSEARKEVDTRFKADSLKPKAAFTVPFPKDEKFVGRDDVLQAIDRRLGKTDSRVALIGLGGVGKSQIAIEYAHRAQMNEPQTSVFWVYARNSTRFRQSYREIAEILCIPGRDSPGVDILELVSRWLCDESNGRWLMILDNADDDRTFYKPTTDTDPNAKALVQFIPRSENGSILITSRNEIAARNLVDEDPSRIIQVQRMTESEALRLLEAKVATDLFLKTDARERRELILALECIPLAISHASAYIDAQRMTLTKYLELFRMTEEYQVKLLSNQDIKNIRRDPSATPAVIATWQISFNQIRDTKPEATDLLALMSMFEAQGIPKDLVTGHMDELASIEALATLIHFSLIRKHQEQDLYEMHGLVQLSTRNWLQRHDLERWRRESLSIMAKAFPSGDYRTWSKCAVLLPHAKVVVDYAPIKQDQDELLHRAKVANNAGWYLCLKGEFTAAESMSKVARNGRENVLGKEHPETLASTNNLALALRGRGMYDEAMELLRDVLEKTEKAPGKEDPVTLSSIHIMATLRLDKGKYTEAESMYRRALEGRQEVLREEHADTLASIDRLGLALRRQGKAEEAEKMHRRALTGRENTLGEDHEDTLSSVNNLSLALLRQRRYQEAEELLQRALEGRKRVLGEEHPHTLTTVDNLGLIQYEQHNYDEAEARYRQALAGRQRTLGQEHPDTLASVHNLAVTLHHQSRYNDAEKLYRQALEGEEKRLGRGHPEVLTTLENLARVLKDQGRIVEAEGMYRRARGEREEVF